jgi:hypothetical protein
MKRNFALISLCLFLSSTTHSQSPPDASSQSSQVPPLLRQAAHCLVTDSPDLHKLLRENRKELNLGYYLDTKSYPGEQALYVVDYSGSKLEKGLAYVFFVRQKDKRRILRVENNASFERKKKGIEFLEKPVGGVWTQEHLEDAIDRIGQDSMYLFSVKEMRAPSTDVSCESYADAR